MRCVPRSGTSSLFIVSFLSSRRDQSITAYPHLHATDWRSLRTLQKATALPEIRERWTENIFCLFFLSFKVVLSSWVRQRRIKKNRHHNTQVRHLRRMPGTHRVSNMDTLRHPCRGTYEQRLSRDQHYVHRCNPWWWPHSGRHIAQSHTADSHQRSFLSQIAKSRTLHFFFSRWPWEKKGGGVKIKESYEKHAATAQCIAFSVRGIQGSGINPPPEDQLPQMPQL